MSANGHKIHAFEGDPFSESTRYMRRMWLLIDRMHSRINDLRAEGDQLAEALFDALAELDTTKPAPPVDRALTLGIVWYVNELDLERVRAGGAPEHKSGRKTVRYLHPVARLRASGWAEVDPNPTT